MAAPFTNDPIPVEDLPQLTNDAFVSVDPRYLRASLAGTGITAAVVLSLGIFLAWQADSGVVPYAIVGVILLLLVLSAGLRVLEVRRLAYQVRAHDISMRSGVITHRVESLPFARVQHVRVNRGAIERALGLATLQISSAGPNITIPGLADVEASRIKLLVTQRAGMDIEDDAALQADAPLEGPPSPQVRAALGNDGGAPIAPPIAPPTAPLPPASPAPPIPSAPLAPPPPPLAE